MVWKLQGLLPMNLTVTFKMWGFPCGSAGKESTCNAGELGLIPGLRRSPGEGKSYPLQYSGLENSMDCIILGVARSQTWLMTFTFKMWLLLEIQWLGLCASLQRLVNGNVPQGYTHVPPLLNLPCTSHPSHPSSLSQGTGLRGIFIFPSIPLIREPACCLLSV